MSLRGRKRRWPYPSLQGSMLERIDGKEATAGSMPALAAQVLRQEAAAIARAADRLTG